MSFFTKAGVILLDNPTDFLNSAEKRNIWQLIRAKKRGRIIIVATQDMQEASVLGDRICLLGDRAQIKLCGTHDFFKEKFKYQIQLIFTFSKNTEN